MAQTRGTQQTHEVELAAYRESQQRSNSKNDKREQDADSGTEVSDYQNSQNNDGQEVKPWKVITKAPTWEAKHQMDKRNSTFLKTLATFIWKVEQVHT